MVFHLSLPPRRQTQTAFRSSLPPRRHVDFSLKVRLPTRRQPSRSIRFPLPPRRQQTFCPRLPLPTRRQANFRRHFPWPARRHAASSVNLSAKLANNPQFQPRFIQIFTKTHPFETNFSSFYTKTMKRCFSFCEIHYFCIVFRKRHDILLKFHLELAPRQRSLTGKNYIRLECAHRVRSSIVCRGCARPEMDMAGAHSFHIHELVLTVE